MVKLIAPTFHVQCNEIILLLDLSSRIFCAFFAAVAATLNEVIILVSNLS